MLVTDSVCCAVMCSSQTIMLVADSVKTVVLVADSVRLLCLWLILSDYRTCG